MTVRFLPPSSLGYRHIMFLESLKRVQGPDKGERVEVSVNQGAFLEKVGEGLERSRR